MIECTCTGQKNRHRELQAQPVRLGLGEVEEVNISEAVIVLGAAKSEGLVISFVAPKLWRESPVKRKLKSIELLPSQIRMDRFGHWEVEQLDQVEGPPLPEVPLECGVVALNEVEELLTILLSKGVSWEILGNKPWESDTIGTNEIHPVGMTPYALVDEPKFTF